MGWEHRSILALRPAPSGGGDRAQGAPLGLDVCRSISIFQLSDIKCYFKWDTDYR